MAAHQAARTLVRSAYLNSSVLLLEERCEPAECVPHKETHGLSTYQYATERFCYAAKYQNVEQFQSGERR
jgi:hypothetical protein